MRALDPLHDEYVFTVSDQAATKAGVFDIVDRLASRREETARNGRRRRASGDDGLGDHHDEPEGLGPLLPRRAGEGPGAADEAAALAREASKEDPDFALARFLALDATWAVWGNNEDAWLDRDKEVETRKALEEVEAFSDRLPEKERLSLRAMRASLEKRWDVAGEIRDHVAAMFPLDKEAIFLAGDIRYHSDSGCARRSPTSGGRSSSIRAIGSPPTISNGR